MSQANVEQQEGQDTEIHARAERLSATFQEIFTMLIERRDTAYEEAIAPLDAERRALAKEYSTIEKAAQRLRELLPAKERVTRREADELLLEGKREEAEAKLREAQQAAEAPAAMVVRQQEILARVHEIDDEKKAIAKQVFEEWYPKCQKVIRAGEHGFFVVLLGGLEQSFYQYQASTGTGMSDNRHRPLLHQGHFSGLTADERSPEWEAGSHWYGVRR